MNELMIRKLDRFDIWFAFLTATYAILNISKAFRDSNETIKNCTDNLIDFKSAFKEFNEHRR
jgi:hypothetical protein